MEAPWFISRGTKDRLSRLEDEELVAVRDEDGQLHWSMPWEKLHIYLGATEDGLQIRTTAEHHG